MGDLAHCFHKPSHIYDWIYEHDVNIFFCHFSFALDWERCSPKERPRHHPAESNRGPPSAESVRAPNWHDTYEPQRVCTSVNHVRTVGRMGRYTCA